MGFNDAMSGYKKLENKNGYSNADLLALLQATEFSCGAPKMGVVAKKEAIVFDPVGRLTVYISASPKAIEIARVVTQGTGKFVLKELGAAMLTDAQSKDTAEADRAVDEVYEVVKGLLTTGKAENKSAANDGIKLYMKQKIVSIRDKYSICTLEEQPVYWVEGNLISLKYKITDANGAELMEIHKKLIAIMPEYTIVQNGKEIASLKKKIRLTRPEIQGTVDGQEVQIKGDLSGYHFAISIGGAVVGSVDTERLTWGDVYSIDIRDKNRQELVVAIAIIIDNLLKAKN